VPTTGTPWIWCFAWRDHRLKSRPAAVHLGIFCISRTTSALAPPAPTTHARRAGPVSPWWIGCRPAVASKNAARRPAPESSQSIGQRCGEEGQIWRQDHQQHRTSTEEGHRSNDRLVLCAGISPQAAVQPKMLHHRLDSRAIDHPPPPPDDNTGPNSRRRANCPVQKPRSGINPMSSRLLGEIFR
jgi:hypothetical protein